MFHHRASVRRNCAVFRLVPHDFAAAPEEGGRTYDLAAMLRLLYLVRALPKPGLCPETLPAGR